MFAIPAAFLALAGAGPGALWIKWHEFKIRSKGSPLPDDLRNWARAMGVYRPGRIRFLEKESVPLPAPMFLRRIVSRLGFPATGISGLCLRRGIYLEAGNPNTEAVLRHELIHTRQYQEAGNIFFFLLSYLFQCLTQGYEDCAMEQEAREDAKARPAIKDPTSSPGFRGPGIA